MPFMRKLQWWLHRRRKEEELREELEFHLTEEAGERRGEGLSSEEAAAAARRDLGNLVRMARIDHGLEIELDREVASGELGEVFATPEELALPAGSSNKCALLYWIYPTAIGDAVEQAPTAALIVLKPKLICDAPLDLKEYAATHAKFPQEPTIDQFFDEAQWESYRKLGLAIAETVFAAGRRHVLWQHIARRLGSLE